MVAYRPAGELARAACPRAVAAVHRRTLQGGALARPPGGEGGPRGPTPCTPGDHGGSAGGGGRPVRERGGERRRGEAVHGARLRVAAMAREKDRATMQEVC